MNVYAGLDVSSRETSVCIRLRMLLGCRKLVVRKLVDVENPVCRRLMTIPGVGPVAALAFRTGVDDPKRFKRSRTVAAHFGMTPRRFQSGGGSTTAAASPSDGDRQVRQALFDAAGSLLKAVSQSVRATHLGLAHHEAQRHQESHRGGIPQAGGDHAPDVARRY